MNVERYLRLICWSVRGCDGCAGLLDQPLLVLIHSVRGPEPVSVGIYELVSHDGDLAEAWREGLKCHL
jgi:hypothetical protein